MGQCLDTGADFPLPGAEKEAETALAFGDVLIRFLGLLPDPIIPASLVARCAEVTNKDDAFQVRFITIALFMHCDVMCGTLTQILEELPAVNLNVCFHFLMAPFICLHKFRCGSRLRLSYIT